MESYTFRCENDDCGRYDSPITGITMAHVIDDGGPICGLCGDDLELVGPDDIARVLPNPHVTATESRIIAEEAAARIGQPTAYNPVPGPPVNPTLGRQL